MAHIIDFEQYRNEEPDISTLDKDALLAYRDQLRARIEALDEEEPADMESGEYEEWGDLHEDLEDLLDEVLDRLEALE